MTQFAFKNCRLKKIVSILRDKNAKHFLLTDTCVVPRCCCSFASLTRCTGYDRVIVRAGSALWAGHAAPAGCPVLARRAQHWQSRIYTADSCIESIVGTVRKLALTRITQHYQKKKKPCLPNFCIFCGLQSKYRSTKQIRRNLNDCV